MTTQIQPMRDRRGRAYTPAIGPRLRPLLWVILLSFAVLGANGFYLASVTALTWYLGTTQQTFFYMLMVLLHLVLGFLLIVPFLVFGSAHLVTSWKRPNRDAVRYGLALLATAIVILVSGLVLVRIGGFEVRDPRVREVGYWLHVAAPAGGDRALCQASPGRSDDPMALGAAVRRRPWSGSSSSMGLLHREDPRAFGVKGPKEGKKYFYPSEAITATGNFIPAQTLMMDDYCLKCHKDAYDGWFHSAHHFSSFNNKPYLFSVRETRKVGARARRLDAGLSLVRRLPRPGAVLLGGVRRSQLRRRQRPDQPGRHHLHGVPRDHQRQQHPRQCGVHDRGAGALSLRQQQEPDPPVDQPDAGQGQARDAQEDVPEAGHQGPPSSARRATRSASPTA